MIAEAEIHSQELFLKGARGEDVSDYEDVDKRIALLKQELQHREKPAELTTTIQKEFISRFMIPTLTRLTKRVSQFDELFAAHRVQLSGQYTGITQYKGQNFSWSPQPPSLEDALRELLRLVEEGNQFQYVNASFQWEGFQRAGLNTFNHWFQLQLAFDKYQYRFGATLMQGQQISAVTNVYQILPDEDQIRSLLTDVAEAFLKHIQNQLKPKG
jgi:hypothetical protein